MKGRIHNLESFGTVDGPGIRYVVFFQGCTMRCKYCHNPDSWDRNDGTEMESEEVLENLLRNKSFYTSGGITASGGEPMLQIDFLTELFQKAKANGIHTALDTSGILFDPANTEKVDRLMEVTDLVMLDIKHMFDDEHKKLTGHHNHNVFAFAEYLKAMGKPVWIRHVVVPGITFLREQLLALGRYIATLPNMEKLEVLRYHALGKVKYDNMGIDYILKDTPQLTKAEGEEAEAIIREGMRGVTA